MKRLACIDSYMDLDVNAKRCKVSDYGSFCLMFPCVNHLHARSTLSGTRSSPQCDGSTRQCM
jgi:hypothetical protein